MPVTASPKNEEGVSREHMIEVREEFRDMVSDVTGWDRLPNAEAFSDALKVLQPKDKLAKALFELLEYHRYMVTTGRFKEAKP